MPQREIDATIKSAVRDGEAKPRPVLLNVQPGATITGTAPAANAAPTGPADSGDIAPGALGKPDPPRLKVGSDDHIAYWSSTARGVLPEPFNEWAAEAIESCASERSAKHSKLLPGAKARRLLERIGQSVDWVVAPPTDRASVIGLLIDGAEMLQRVVDAGLGRANKPPGPLPDDDKNEPLTLADITDEPVIVIAAGVFYGGKFGIVHGPSFNGKSTLLGNVLACVTTGRPWLGRETLKGEVIIMVEEPSTYRAVVKAGNGDPSRVRIVRQWSKLASEIARIEPVAVVVDTLQFVAHQVGGLDLNQPGETDMILRPLERAARDYGCAVVATDHEPHADTGANTKDRPRGSTAKGATADYVLRCTRDGDVTTVRPNRGAARLGIDVFTFHVDRHGRPTIDRPAELPPAVTGGTGAGEGDGQPFADRFAKWRDHEPAIRAILTTTPAVTDHALVKAIGLPKGRNWTKPDGAKAFLQSIRDAMIRESAERGSAAPETSPLEPRNRAVPPDGSATVPPAVPLVEPPGTATVPVGGSGVKIPIGGTAPGTAPAEPRFRAVPEPPTEPLEPDQDGTGGPAAPVENPEDHPPTDATDQTADVDAAVADIFARGAALRERWAATEERPDGPDGPLPARIRERLLSDDPAQRRAGHRQAALDHYDGGKLGRGLTVNERAAFMRE